MATTRCFRIAERGPPVSAGLAGGTALSLARTAATRSAPPVDERATQLAFDSITTEMDARRKDTIQIVTLLTPMAGHTDVEEAGHRARAHRERLERLQARVASAGEALLVQPAELSAQSSKRLGLVARARGLVFVTWTQVECVKRLQKVAEWSRCRSRFTLGSWADGDSPMARAHYGESGVPLVAAFLETALAGLKRAAARGGQAGPELAEILSDLQLVAWAAAQADWEPRALALLAPHVKAFKAGLSELSGREALSMRWTAWCLWSWPEAGRAQGNGRFYRTSALEGLERLQVLVPGAGARLGQLAGRLRATWQNRGSRN